VQTKFELKQKTQSELQLQKEIENAHQLQEQQAAMAKLKLSEEITAQVANDHPIISFFEFNISYSQREIALKASHDTERMYTSKIDFLQSTSKAEVKCIKHFYCISSFLIVYLLQIETLQKKLADSEAIVQELTKSKYQCDVKLEQLAIRVKELETTNELFGNELNELKAQNKQLDQSVFQKVFLLKVITQAVELIFALEGKNDESK